MSHNDPALGKESLEIGSDAWRDAIATTTAALGDGWLVAGILAVLLLAALVGWARARSRVGRANRVRGRRARRAETDAERWLEARGYFVLDRQVTTRFEVTVDGTPREVSCRADLLLEYDGRLYVADVKTGAEAPNPTLPATRRQLLEYLLAFDADGALLVDMNRREVVEVAFPGLLGGMGGSVGQVDSGDSGRSEGSSG